MSETEPAGPVTTDTVAALLQQAGYRATAISEKIVRSATNGLNFVIGLDNGNWLQFAVSLGNRGTMDLPGVNQFNAKYKYCRLYLDSDDDMLLEADFYLAGDFATVFATYMGCWDNVTGALLMFARERTRAAPAELTAPSPA